MSPDLPQETRKTRVLVLGSSGRVGRMLRHAWAQDSAGLDFIFQTRDPAAAHDLLWNVLGPLPVTLQQAAPFECMIVLSGVVPKPDADFALNSRIGAASITAAARLGIKTVILASTSAVYGSHQRTPFHEGDPTHPVNAYGTSKLAMETLCQHKAQTLGVRLCCLRIGNVAGADALLRGAGALAEGETLALDMFPDQGTPLRSYIGPQSLAQALCTLVHKRAQVPPLLNMAAPQPVTMRALAQASATPFVLHPAPPTAHQHITLACTALAALHPFDPVESDPDEMVRQWQHVTQA